MVTIENFLGKTETNLAKECFFIKIVTMAVNIEIKRKFFDVMSLLDKVPQLSEKESSDFYNILDEIWYEIFDLAEELGFDLDKIEYEGICPEVLALHDKWENLLPICSSCDYDGPFTDCFKAREVRNQFISDLQNLRRVIERQSLRSDEQINMLLDSINASPKENKVVQKVAKKKHGRPKVSKEEENKRRKLKDEWERYRCTIDGANKESFCYENDIKVNYLNNTVLRWCRDHPK